MKYYCDVCDKTTKLKPKHTHVKSLTHNPCEKRFRINHTIKNPNFLDLDRIFNEYITNRY